MAIASSILTADNLTVPHGFSTRLGGVSSGVYASLNLGLSTGDARAAVAENRRRFLAHFGLGPHQVCALQQVHGAAVHLAEPGWYLVKADAAITATPGLALVISTADCLPILIHDPVRRAIGAAHAGWRGTAQGIAAALVQALTAHFGSDPADLQVAIGPGIQHPCYQVGSEVKDAFAAAGVSAQVITPDDAGHFRLDLVRANREQLSRVGVSEAQVRSLDVCTHCDAERFYSHRRDGRARGSHWALVVLPEVLGD
jgi:YfiH family protein